MAETLSTPSPPWPSWPTNRPREGFSMRKHLQRMECPACLGMVMERVSVAAGVEVDHCARCGGTWIPREQAPRLRQVPAAALRATITRRDNASFLCHGCHAAIHRDAVACEACNWANTLDCPDCGKRMRRGTTS